MWQFLFLNFESSGMRDHPYQWNIFKIGNKYVQTKQTSSEIERERGGRGRSTTQEKQIYFEMFTFIGLQLWSPNWFETNRIAGRARRIGANTEST